MFRARSRSFTVRTDGGPVVSLVPKRLRYQHPEVVVLYPNDPPVNGLPDAT